MDLAPWDMRHGAMYSADISSKLAKLAQITMPNPEMSAPTSQGRLGTSWETLGTAVIGNQDDQYADVRTKIPRTVDLSHCRWIPVALFSHDKLAKSPGGSI